MNYFSEQIVWQEVPGEVSLAFTISGCPLACPGCHSAASWPATAGQLLTPEYLSSRLQQYQGLLTCVLFMGGEWLMDELLLLLRLARAARLKTCLYTGLDEVPESLKPWLTYAKTGPWRRELGGLEAPGTNQVFTDLRTGACLNHQFHQ